MAATGIAAAAAAGGGAAAGTLTIGQIAAIAAIAATATYASQSMARRQAQVAERKAGTEGPQLASFRSSSAPRQIIYGTARTGGPLAYMSTTFGNNFLLMDVMLAGHECASIDEVWLDDYPLTLTSMVTGWGYAARTEWQDSGDPDAPVAVTVVENAGMTTPVWVEASAGRYNVRDGIILFGCELEKLGHEGQGASDLFLACAPPGHWTAQHRLRGICHVPLAFAWAPDAFQSGPPNPTFVVSGKKLYDPRLDSTRSGGSGSHRSDDDSTWAHSSNSALCLLDYLLDTRLGLGAATTEIDFPSFMDAADICDETVTLASGGTELRYTTNGVLRTDDTHENNIGSLLSAMEGKLVYSGGKFRLYAGAFSSSVQTFTEDDLRGPITIQTQQERAKIVNGVRGVFSSPDNNWQVTDYPPVTSSTYYAADQNERIWMDLPLPMTTSATTAQRLAKIAMERSRRQIVVQMPAKLTALNVLPGETVALTFTRYGWSAKTFTVDELRLVTEEDENGEPRYGVDLVLREIDSNVFVWTSSEEASLPAAPTTELPNPFDVRPPSSIEVSETLYVARAPVVQSRATIAWGPSQDAFVRTYRPRYKLHSASVWTTLPDTNGSSADILDLVPGDYDFAVAAVNSAGNLSAYVQTRQTLYGLLTPPAALSGLTIQTAGGLAILTWSPSTDVDVLVGGRIEVRHSNATTGAVWSTATPIGAAYPGSAALAVLPLKAGTYLVRPYDSSEMAGTASSVTTDGATALTYSSLSTLTEDTAFSGSKTSTVVSASKLKLDAVGDWDSASSVDAIVDVDGLGGIAGTGSYAFATTMDLGSSKRVRLQSRVVATVVAVLDRVDSRNQTMDSWATFDGTDGDECEAWVECRHSPDNATWSSWERLDASEAQDRYFQFRAQLRSYSADYNIEISELRASAAEIV